MPENLIKDATYRFGEFELNSTERVLLRNGERVSLTPRALDLLLVLVEGKGRLLTKDKLMNTVWADAIVEEGNLNRTISALRKALGEAKGENRFIETVPKAGYRFVALVEPIAFENGAATASIVERNDPPQAVIPLAPIRHRWLIGLTAFVLLFGALVASSFLVKRQSPTFNDQVPGITRLTNSQFNEDGASWTADGQIRFLRFVTANRAESWVMNSDGADQHRANDRIKDLLAGNWSPDGKQVVFIKEGGNVRDVYLANSDGSGERKLPLNFPPNDWSPDGKKLVYSSVVEGSNSDIFVYDLETDKRVNITDSPDFDADPLFSPDGSQIIFVSSRDGKSNAYIIDIDGKDLRRVTNNIAKAAFPSLAPDGTQIVFDSNHEDENVDIYLQNVNDTSPPIKLTNLPSNEEHRGHCWSPDGTKMVITSDREGKTNIYVLDVEAFRSTLVVSDPAADLEWPAVAPDGTKLAYEAKYDEKSSALMVVDITGGSGRSIYRSEPNTANFALSPSFSPDGLQIVFTTKLEGNTEICLIRQDGSSLVNLTQNDAADGSPVFSSDGKEIFFNSNRDGAFERFHLFRMNTDGTDQRRITDKDGYEFSPAPFLSGKYLVFSGDRVDGSSRALDIRMLDLGAPGEEKIIASFRQHDVQPAVSPDGRRIAFVAQTDGNSEIYLMNSDGTGLLRITRNAAEDISPKFSTDSRSIFFSSNRSKRYAIYESPLER